MLSKNKKKKPTKRKEFNELNWQQNVGVCHASLYSRTPFKVYLKKRRLFKYKNCRKIKKNIEHWNFLIKTN